MEGFERPQNEIQPYLANTNPIFQRHASDEIDGLDSLEDVLEQFREEKELWTAHSITTSLLDHQKAPKVIYHKNYIDAFNCHKSSSIQSNNSSESSQLSMKTVQNSA